MKIRAVIHVAVEIDNIDPEWIDRTQTDEWRRELYDLTRDGAAEMIACNLGRGRRLDQLDGWADVPYRESSLIDVDSVWDCVDVEIIP